MHTCAVVVPMYQARLSPVEQVSLEQTVEVLAEYPVFLVGPELLEPYFKKLQQQFSRIQYQTFSDRFFASIDGYNNLLLSEHFYKRFSEYEYMLIVQTDALVLTNCVQAWCAKQYSYVGAPWFDGFTTPTYPLTLNSVGNGGFSLRRIPDFLKVLSRPRVFRNTLMQGWPGNWASTLYRYIKDYHSVVFKDVHLNIDVNEDVFWGLFVRPQCSFFRVPSAIEAVSFSFEAHPDHLYELNRQQLPFGVHAWQRYQPEFWQQILPQHGLHHLLRSYDSRDHTS
jgi:hypothetical protein